MSLASSAQNFGRNDACPCGSGRKYKKCCGQSNATPPPQAKAGGWSDIAVQYIQTGDLAAAERVARQALAVNPRDAVALNVCGIVAAQTGRRETALALFQRSVAIVDQAPETHMNLGNAYKDLGRHEEAVPCYERALRLAPSYAAAQYNLGEALEALGRLDAAEDSYRKTLALQPDFVQAYNNLGNVLSKRERYEEAIAVFQRGVALDPEYVSLWYNLALTYQSARAAADAVRCLGRVLTLEPSHAQAHHQLGLLWLDDGQFDKALKHIDIAVKLQPDEIQFRLDGIKALVESGRLKDATAEGRALAARYPSQPEAHVNLGLALEQSDLPAEAESCFKRAIELAPDEAEWHWNLGRLYSLLGREAEGQECYERGLGIDPADADAHFNYATALLRSGHWALGWDKYEWRFSANTGVKLLASHGDYARWTGETARERTLHLYAEQGFGDGIQFIRYVPWAAERCGQVIVECAPELLRLFRSVTGVHAVVERGQAPAEVDLFCPLMSLPRLAGTTPDNVPAVIPYLAASADDISAWASRLGKGSRPKVGLVWAGSTSYPADRDRSIALATLAPLGQVPGITWYSLQKGWTGHPLHEFGCDLIDLTADLKDFADTAALLAHLDLVVSVDSAVAHLAGALGKPVWMLSRYAGDWRWLRNREDTPWYPSMHIFSQRRPRDWPEVIARVADALRDWTDERRELNTFSY